MPIDKGVQDEQVGEMLDQLENDIFIHFYQIQHLHKPDEYDFHYLYLIIYLDSVDQDDMVDRLVLLEVPEDE